MRNSEWAVYCGKVREGAIFCDRTLDKRGFVWYYKKVRALVSRKETAA